MGGLFNDINNKINMPKTLYISEYFSLDFETDGEITSFYGFFYGKNDKDELESYLISYDINKSKKIDIYLNGDKAKYYEGSCIFFSPGARSNCLY